MGPVGERALAACRHPDGWDLFHAQQGARLRADPRTYAGHPESLESLLEGEWAFRRRCSARTLPSALDYLSYEAVYVLTPDRVVVCVPLWFGLPLADGPTAPTCGALTLAASPGDARRLESGTQERKRLLGDALAADLVGVPEVLEALALSVRPRTVGVGSTLERVLILSAVSA
ncbi:MAG: hypothetical protein V5A55_14535 [Halovenus sp.]